MIASSSSLSLLHCTTMTMMEKYAAHSTCGCGHIDGWMDDKRQFHFHHQRRIVDRTSPKLSSLYRCEHRVACHRQVQHNRIEWYLICGEQRGIATHCILEIIKSVLHTELFFEKWEFRCWHAASIDGIACSHAHSSIFSAFSIQNESVAHMIQHQIYKCNDDNDLLKSASNMLQRNIYK